MSKPVKKTIKSNTRKRRSHHGLGKSQFVNCESCGASMKAHTACPECGNYKGRTVTDAPAKRMARRVRRLKPMS